MADPNPNDIIPKRVLFELPGMRDVLVRRDVAYREGPDGPLTMDVYYPPGDTHTTLLPAVVIVTGYCGSMKPRLLDCTYKELGWTISTAQLLAVSGIATIAYHNDDAIADAHAVLGFVRDHANELGIDAERIGVWACSGNCPTALSLMMQPTDEPVRAAVLLCGYLLDLDGATGVADMAARYRFADACAGRSIADVRREVPIFLARAGRDQSAGVNESIDAFVTRAVAANLPLTFANHAEGPHGFELFDDSAATRAIVRQALGFMQDHLGATAPTALS
jgi:hypothetical protein